MCKVSVSLPILLANFATSSRDFGGFYLQKLDCLSSSPHPRYAVLTYGNSSSKKLAESGYLRYGLVETN